jgi:hypothetical protein
MNKEKIFKIISYFALGLIIVLLLVSVFGKSQDTQGNNQIAMFGKTLWKAKPTADKGTATDGNSKTETQKGE